MESACVLKCDEGYSLYDNTQQLKSGPQGAKYLFDLLFCQYGGTYYGGPKE